MTPDEEATFRKALAIAHDPFWAPALAAKLLMYLRHEDISQAVQSVTKTMADMERYRTSQEEALEQLERERAKFHDPNRPGE